GSQYVQFHRLSPNGRPWPFQQRVNSNWGRAEASECANRATTRVFFAMQANEHTTARLRTCADPLSQRCRVCPSATTGRAADRSRNVSGGRRLISLLDTLSALNVCDPTQQSNWRFSTPKLFRSPGT